MFFFHGRSAAATQSQHPAAICLTPFLPQAQEASQQLDDSLAASKAKVAQLEGALKVGL